MLVPRIHLFFFLWGYGPSPHLIIHPRSCQGLYRVARTPLLSSMALSRQCPCLLLFMNSSVVPVNHRGCFDAVWHAGIWRKVKVLCLSPRVVDEDAQCWRQWNLSKQIHWVEGGPPLFPSHCHPSQIYLSRRIKLASVRPVLPPQ